ncbi:hypothetical protein chiPu_0022220 [Chiloscyllium punctatum]|uniref:Uncharacterized protein n=1 Tax=Chiloscyllium punctatum TaxID=137246 RepID=A0A401REB7_CHIPU|nr:hypothetical protein [Chiloscyllium punctatum]
MSRVTERKGEPPSIEQWYWDPSLSTFTFSRPEESTCHGPIYNPDDIADLRSTLNAIWPNLKCSNDMLWYVSKLAVIVLPGQQ